jgi:Domain of Unknown Function (DUF1540).
MQNNQSRNSSIGCSVTECQYNAKDASYCTLDKIQVGKHETKATQPECTDCESFKADTNSAW